ncbi:MAG: hypothetical protein J5695_05820 [Bacteroidales bacterium]|nr:hypothetical protein [Bacteroidales bacterium]
MNDKGGHKNCVVLLTHRMDGPMIGYLRYLNAEISEVMDFYILYDCHAQSLDPADYPDLQFHLFDSGTIKGFFHCGHPRIPNPLLPLLEFAKEKEYRHYLVMEGDLVFTGEWRTFVRKVNGLACDYVHIASDVMGDPRHWPCKYIKDNPFPHLYFAWCHLFYASRRFLADLEAFMQENDTVYYEFLLPSLAYCKGYYVRQFENFGYQFQVSWGPPEVYERKYLEEHTANTFYHPVKNSSIIKY